jgi:hypothetical protein
VSAGGRAHQAPLFDQQAFELPTGQPVIRNVGAAIAAASVEAAAAGYPDAHEPANQSIKNEEGRDAN